MFAAFKDSWHKADLAPGAQDRYLELKGILKSLYNARPRKYALFSFKILAMLGKHPQENRRVIPDAMQAYTMMSLFFSFTLSDYIFEDDVTESLLLDQTQRAREPPLRRSHLSNKLRPKRFWKEWDDFSRALRQRERYNGEPNIPPEWSLAIRPILAHCE